MGKPSFSSHGRECCILTVLQHSQNLHSDYKKAVLSHVSHVTSYKSKNIFSLKMLSCLHHLVIFFPFARLVILSKIIFIINFHFLVMGKKTYTEMNFPGG